MDNLDKRQRYAQAMGAERDAWNEVKHTLPGSPEFDEGKWKRWRAALHVVADALDDKRESESPHPKAGHDPHAR
jgi:hypothetical protein